MKRRDFIANSILTFGGLMVGRNCLYSDVISETSTSFTIDAERGYDVVINSAGVCGAFSALAMAKRGLRVLVVERRTCAGSEMVDKFKLSLDKTGYENWGEGMKKIFFPDGEKLDINNENLSGDYNSTLGDKVVFLAGSINKGLTRSLVLNGVDILFMGEVFGVYKDANNDISGVAIATKQGAIAVKCGAFVDCADTNLLTRNIARTNFDIAKSTFTLRTYGAKKAPSEFEINLKSQKIKAKVSYGKTRKDQADLTFEVPCKSSDFSDIEKTARLLAIEILENKNLLPKGLQKISRIWFARECSHTIKGNFGDVKIGNYFVLENSTEINSCADVFSLYAKGVKFGESVVGREAKKSVKLVSANGEFAVGDFGKAIVEDGVTTPFYKFDFSTIKAEKISCDVLVAGVGSAGVYALKSATDRGVNALGVDCFHDYGGTKVNGGVTGYYWCVKSHPLIRKSTGDAKKAQDLGVTGGTIFSVVNAKLLENAKALTGGILCGASVVNGKLDGAYFSRNSKLYFVESKVAIDCTGDADLADFAGVPFVQGENRTGVAINFSKWEMGSVAAQTPERKNISKDLGIVDITKILDYQRAMLVAHYEASYFDSCPQLTPRDTRRPLGLKTLELREALEGIPSKDIIAQACSDYDPHSFPLSKYVRTALMVSHFPHYYAVNIPFGCVVPKNLNGLLLGGRSISVSHDVLQFTRMSGDVATLGEVEGRIAADFAKQGGNLADFDISKIVAESQSLGYYTADYKNRKNAQTTELVERLKRGDADALLWICLKDKAEALPLLQKSYKELRSLQTAYALAWFGDASGEKTILFDLAKNVKAQESEASRKDYFELYWRGDMKSPYWNVNRALAFLAMAGSDASENVVAEILAKAESGGDQVRSKDNAYHANRIDLVLLPNHNRIGNLCFYVERRPSAKFVPSLEKLLADKFIAGNSTRNYTDSRFRIYKGLLEMLVASATARCGSYKGAKVLVEYLADCHANFRAFARQELSDIYQTDFGFDGKSWLKFAKQQEGKVAKPLSEKYA